MKKHQILKMLLGTIFFIFIYFFFSANKVSAQSVGDVVTHTGVLQRHENPAFTHRLDGINLIINSFFDSYLGQTVSAGVRYVDNNFNFVVESITLMEATDPGVGSPAPTQPTQGNVLEGTLSLSPLTGMVYRISPDNSFPVDIIVPRIYDSWLGSRVRLTYSGPLSGFTVLALEKV